jgi:hypothetical protein|tara:strand:- start:92 stop:325 length:234 start_codon:yes stop_codon:yes gene_type:complete
MVALVESLPAYRGRGLITRQDRRVQIEALGVDRSRFVSVPMVRWSPEAEVAEEWLRPIRREATISDKLAAWRVVARR